jgi:hypothetical protein
MTARGRSLLNCAQDEPNHLSDFAYEVVAYDIDGSTYQHGHLSLIERYVRGELRLHLHLWLGGAGKPAKLCTVLHHPGDDYPGFTGTKTRLEVQGPSTLPPPTEMKGAVLVDVAELMQEQEKGNAAAWLPYAVERLNLLDSSLCSLAGNAPHFVEARTVTGAAGLTQLVEKPSVIENGELRLGNPSAEVIDKVVQGGPQVVEHLPNDDRPTERDVSRVVDQKCLTGLLIKLLPDSIEFTIKPSLAIGLEKIEVLYGPEDFLPNALEH